MHMISAVLNSSLKRAAEGAWRLANMLRGSTADQRCAIGCRGCDGTAYCALRTAMLARHDLAS
ncbi:MAG: hypothetical protein C0454_14200 [Parvibaculum sp.]|jgi:hypothetical protein|nr:hypothetical protein [Parvibaculum sp.]